VLKLVSYLDPWCYKEDFLHVTVVKTFHKTHYPHFWSSMDFCAWLNDLLQLEIMLLACCKLCLFTFCLVPKIPLKFERRFYHPNSLNKLIWTLYFPVDLSKQWLVNICWLHLTFSPQTEVQSRHLTTEQLEP